MIKWGHKEINQRIQEALQGAPQMPMSPLDRLRAVVEKTKGMMGIPQREL